MTKNFMTIVGVHTGVGKTYITTQLLQSAKESDADWRGVKPLISGWEPNHEAESDTGLLLTAQNCSITSESIAAISPWRYRASLGVTQAAQKEGKVVIFDDLISFCVENARKSEILVVETTGGLMSPITPTQTNLDWLLALGGRVVLVTGNYLGAINHTLMALAVLKAVGVTPTLVMSECSTDLSLRDAIEGLEPFIQRPLIVVPKNGSLGYEI